MLIGNTLQIREFKNAFENKKCPVKICLCGPSGSGKTTLANSILSDFNVFKCHVCSSENLIVSIKHFISSAMNQIKPKLVFFEDIDIQNGATTGNHKRQLSKIIELCGDNIFVLFTCRLNQEYFLIDKSKFKIIKINYPRVNEAFAYLLNKIDIAPDILLEKTRLYKGSIREIILNLDFKSSRSKFKTMTDFEITKQLLLNPKSCDETIEKKEIVPFLMYENFKTDSFDIYEKINDNFLASFKAPISQNDVRFLAFKVNMPKIKDENFTKFRFPELFYLR